MIHALVKGSGGTVWTEFPTGRPDTCAVSVCDDAGSVRASGQATVDAVSTTTAAPVAAKALIVTVASAAGIIAGRRYCLGTEDGAEPWETVTVKSVAGSVATLWAPTIYAHAAGAAFVGTRVSFAVPGAACSDVWTNGQVMFTPASGDPQLEAVHCVRAKIPEQLITLADVRQVFSAVEKLIGSRLDVPLALLEARNSLLIDLGAGISQVHAIVAGGLTLRRLASLKFIIQRGPELGEDGKGIIEAATTEYDAGMEKLTAQLAQDGNQDGATNGDADQQGICGSVRLMRAG